MILVDELKKKYSSEESTDFQLGEVKIIPVDMMSCETAIQDLLNFILTNDHFDSKNKILNSVTLPRPKTLSKKEKPRSSTLLSYLKQSENLKQKNKSPESKTFKRTKHSTKSFNKGFQDVIIHFGVNVFADKIHLEEFAINEADFLNPDNHGNLPWQVKIDPAKGIFFQRKTHLDLNSVMNQVDPNELYTSISDSDGTFICNYLYYNSLWRCSEYMVDSLFIHVPLFENVPHEIQLNLLDKIIKNIVLQKKMPSKMRISQFEKIW